MRSSKPSIAAGSSSAVGQSPRSVFSIAIAAATHELLVETAATPEQLMDVERLRYREECEERGFGEPHDLERDCFDTHSRHVLVRSRVTGAALCTVRLVLPTTLGSGSLPMRNVCEDDVFSSVPATQTGEVSRFILTRYRSGVSPAAAAAMRLSLMRGLIEISAQVGLTHWCAIMECTLLRLLGATAIYFEAIGPAVDRHGRKEPVVWALRPGLSRVRHERPDVWEYVTGHGTLIGQPQ